MDDFDYEYKKKCREISGKIQPRPEFIDELKANLRQESSTNKYRYKYCLSKVAVVFCTVALVTTGGVFAKDIGNWFTNLFKNTDPSINLAIENGYVQNVDMDYIEHDGIGIKVNSIIFNDNKLDVVFDIKGEVEGNINFESVFLDENKLNIEEQNSEKIMYYNKNSKSIDKNNHILILQFANLKENILEFEELNIGLNKIYMCKDEIMLKTIDKYWNFSIKIEDNIK